MRITIMLAVTLLSVGCAMNAPQYETNFDLVNYQKDLDIRPIAVGDFDEAEPSLNKISLRGSSMKSTYGDSYGKYLQQALMDQLAAARLLDLDSDVQVSGTLLENSVDPAMGTGTARVAAQFVITVDGVEYYNQKHLAYHEWESSFFGNVAIPNAQANYAVAVQKLVSDFLLDERVTEILKN